MAKYGSKQFVALRNIVSDAANESFCFCEIKFTALKRKVTFTVRTILFTM